jgi:galactose oxidase-like protein
MRTTAILLACMSCASSHHLREPRASHSASLLADGTILVAGGFRKGPDGVSQLYTATTELVDAAGGTVRAGPPLHDARAGHLAVTLGDGRILLAGGWNASGMLHSAELYDPARGRFAPAGDMVEPRGGAAATLLRDGRVLVTGGGDNVATASTELFDPRDGRFHAAGSLIAPRIGHTATLLPDGRVLVAGGVRRKGEVLASAELYDPATDTFTALAASLHDARYKHAALALADGRVLIVGGSDARDWTGKLATTELFDPATERFTPGPALTTARFKLPHAVALRGGDLLVAGGAATVERVRPGAASQTIASLGDARYYDTATLTADRLVVIGGYDDRAQAHADVWVIATGPASVPAR